MTASAPDICTATRRVLNAAAAGRRALVWCEQLAGDKALAATGEYLPAATIEALARIGPGSRARCRYLPPVTTASTSRYAANPSALILSGELLLRELGWHEAAALVVAALERVLAERVTDDFHRQFDADATLLSCSAFAAAVVDVIAA